jgi:hypothetical protein
MLFLSVSLNWRFWLPRKLLWISSVMQPVLLLALVIIYYAHVDYLKD